MTRRREVVAVLDEKWPEAADSQARQFAMEDCADRILDEQWRWR
jgi:hypothetical protein